MSLLTDKIQLNEETLLIKTADDTIKEQFTETSSLSTILKWYEKHVYRHLYVPLCPREEDSTVKCSHSDALQMAIELLYNCEIDDKNKFYLSASANIFPLKSYSITSETLSLSYQSWSHTLHDLALYSPYAIDGCHLRLLFIIYQLLKAIFFVHQRGLSTGPLQLTDFHVNERYWIQMKPRFQSSLTSLDFNADSDQGGHLEASHHDDDCHVHSTSAADREETSVVRLRDDSTIQTTVSSPLSIGSKLTQSNIYHVQHRYETYCRTEIDIVELLKQWQLGHVSNFDYLLILNALSGRRFDNPEHHLIFPWIHDFTDPTKNFRDLSKSKYRLNKGDPQLDLTYNYYSNSVPSSTNIVPHHLSEHLSSITFHIYNARRTDKRILCENVRPIWVPHEYPSSINRLYAWTPEECIPEFFYDPTIFQSIHDDLPDLLVPDWCSSPEEFVQKHRQLLESREVSENLHLWIDLIFGYRLAGDAAIEGKNVCLPLVDHHEDLRNSGIVQLFLKPHPTRFISLTKQTFDQNATSWIDSRTNSIDTQSLTNALSDTFFHLDAFEQLLMLTSTSFGRLPSASFTNRTLKYNSTFLTACERDLKYFGVCIVELILMSKQHYVSANANGPERLKTVKQLLNFNWRLIPVALRTCLQALLLNNDNVDENSTENRLSNRAISAAYFLNRWTTPLPFPFYFEDLYRLLHQIEQIDQQLLNASTAQQKNLQTKKYGIYVNQVPSLLMIMHTQNHHELLMPYIFDAFRDPNYGARCLYVLFNPVATVLGVEESRKLLIPVIQNVFNPERTTVHHWRCFTKRFITQMIARFGLSKFLNSFSMLLIEACSGFKDELSIKTDINAENNDPNSNIKDKTMESAASILSCDDNQILVEAFDENQQSMMISDTAAETIIHLQIKLGPVLGCKYFGRHLLRMLILCYLDDEQLQVLPSDKNPFKSVRAVRGDLNARRIVDCLLSLIQTYGEQIIFILYFPHLIEMVRLANHRLSIRNEAALLSCIVLLRCILPYLSDSKLMDQLADPIKSAIIHPYLVLIASPVIHFPSYERCRSICAYKILDVLINLCLRLGYETTRIHMSDSIRIFFSYFQYSRDYEDQTKVDSIKSSPNPMEQSTFSPNITLDNQNSSSSVEVHEYCRITVDNLTNSYKIGSPMKPNLRSGKHVRTVSHSLLTTQVNEDENSTLSVSTRESIQQEIDATFTIELACTAFIQFCRLCGDQHMNALLTRTDAIHACITDLTSKPDAMQQSELFSSISANDVLTSICDRDIRYQTSDDSRFLRKNWLSYWEHEIGRGENNNFSFKQIHLQTFSGHTNAVRSMHVLDDESTFFSGGRDQRFLVWKIENQNDNGIKVESRWSYSGYRKSVFSISFLDAIRLAATCDGSIHVVDPFRGQLVCRYTQPKDSLPYSAMTAIPSPSTNILAITTDATVRFLDVRTKAPAFDWKVSLGTSSQVKTLGISPNATTAVVGFNTGTISVFDVRNGYIMGSLKLPEGEVIKTSFYSRHRFFTSSGEGPIFLWNTNELSPCTPTVLKSHVEPAPFVLTTRSSEFIVATQTNKLCIYSRHKGGTQMDFQCNRLQSDNIKGTLSSVGLLPENRLLLFGTENGNIELLC